MYMIYDTLNERIVIGCRTAVVASKLLKRLNVAGKRYIVLPLD